MTLPRLLDEKRVEVRLVPHSTFVLREDEIDGMLLHLRDAKALLAKPAASVPTCGCDPVAGIVCPACQVMADKNVNELADYVNDFIEKRFPSGLKGDIRGIIAECVLDAFHDGARWCEKTAREESVIIGVDRAAKGAERSIILSPR